MSIIKHELTESVAVSPEEYGSYLIDLMLRRTGEDGLPRFILPTTYSTPGSYASAEVTPYDMMSLYGVYVMLDVFNDGTAMCSLNGNSEYITEPGPHILNKENPELPLYVPDWQDTNKIIVYAVLQWMPEN